MNYDFEISKLKGEVANLTLFTQEIASDIRKINNGIDFMRDTIQVLEARIYALQFIEINPKVEKVLKEIERMKSIRNSFNDALDELHDKVHKLEIQDNMKALNNV